MTSVELRDKRLMKSVFLRFFLPAMIAGASANLAGMIDGLIVGNMIGSDALSAVNFCRPAMQVYAFLSEILASGVVSCIAMAGSRGEKERVNRFFTSGVTTACMVATVLTLLQFLFSGPVCHLLVTDETIYPLALEYYRIFLFSTFFVLISEPIAATMRTDGFPIMSGIVLLLPHILNAVFDAVFVGVFDWGLRGAATATVLGYAIGFILAAYYMIARRSFKFDFKNFFRGISIIGLTGAPPAVNMGLIAIKLVIVNRLVEHYGGTVGAAVLSVIMVAWALQSLIVGGVKMTMMPMISYYYADGDYHGVHTVFEHALRVLVTGVLALVAFLEIFPRALPYLFGLRGEELLSEAEKGMRIFAPFLLLEALIMLIIVYYTSTTKRAKATFFSVLQGILAILPVIFPLAYYFGLTGIWVAFPVSSLIPLVVLAIQCRGSVDVLLDMEHEEFLQEITLKQGELAQALQSVKENVCRSGFDDEVAQQAGIVLEAMTGFISDHNPKRRPHIDVTLRKKENGLLITFYDDGIANNPLKFRENHPEEEGGSAQYADLMSFSDKMEYSHVIGLNKTSIILKSL